VTNINPYEGTYSAKSGAISNSQSSILSIIINVTSVDTVSFYKKVSCEDAAPNLPTYDYLEFFIDNTSMGKWDGEESWSKSSYAIATGVHTLKWVYNKDNYGIAGSDCVWLDNIKFPSGFVSKAPLSCTLTAAADTIFENTPIQLQTTVNGGLGNNVFTYTANQNTTTLSGSNPTVSPYITTVYSVTVTDANNAIATASFTLYVKALNISENTLLNTKVYPNPFNTSFTVEFSMDENAKISIINALGQVLTPEFTIFTSVNNKQMFTINTTSFEKGIYFIQLKTANNSFVKKLIKID
jgi:hypothetical protein